MADTVDRSAAGLQPEYQAMVDARLVRDRRSATDLNKLRQQLTRAVGRHCNAVLALLDERDPTSLPLVLEALRPVEVFRAQSSSGGSSSGGNDGEEPTDEALEASNAADGGPVSRSA